MSEDKRSIKKLVGYADQSEKAIEAYLVRKVRQAGGLCLKFSSHTETGYPDRLLLLPEGKAAWVEVKSKGQKPRLIQRLRISELQGLGFPVWVADSRAKVDEIMEEVAR